MEIRKSVIEMQKEIEELKKENAFTEENGSVATEVVHIMKKNTTRMYIVILILIVLFVVSVVDSIWQRHKLIELLEDMEIVEETVTETYDMSTEDGNNNYVGGDNNGEIKNN